MKGIAMPTKHQTPKGTQIQAVNLRVRSDIRFLIDRAAKARVRPAPILLLMRRCVLLKNPCSIKPSRAPIKTGPHARGRRYKDALRPEPQARFGLHSHAERHCH
jgi:hypothetical protein